MWFKYDDCDEELVRAHRWHTHTGGYPMTSKVIDGKRRTLYFHRLVTNAGPGEVVDHINGDKTDNRRANLRVVSPSVNMQNRVKTPRNNRSGHIGVSYLPSTPTQKRKKCWVAHAKMRKSGLTKSGRITIGYFATREEAIAATIAWRVENMPGFIAPPGEAA